MEYLPGGDLNSFIRAGLEPFEAEQILKQLAQALHFAHSKGYIHRDVKPDNIMFREDHSVVLTDFGIARPIETATNITSQGLVISTPAFMSPEQSITIEESSYRKLGVAKRYAFHCQLSSDDPQHFTVLFGQFTTRLIEWHQANGKQCGIIKLDISITERLLPRVLQLIEQLHIKDFKQTTLKTLQG